MSWGEFETLTVYRLSFRISDILFTVRGSSLPECLAVNKDFIICESTIAIFQEQQDYRNVREFSGRIISAKGLYILRKTPNEDISMTYALSPVFSIVDDGITCSYVLSTYPSFFDPEPYAPCKKCERSLELRWMYDDVYEANCECGELFLCKLNYEELC